MNGGGVPGQAVGEAPVDEPSDPDREPRAPRRARLWTWLGMATTALLVLVLMLFWGRSLVPSEYSVMGMGTADFGGGPIDELHARHDSFGWLGPPRRAADVSVADLSGPRRGADVSYTLRVAAGQVELADGRQVAGYTVNGVSPGPALLARQGDLVEVRLINESVSAGVSLHWHGVDVPNAEDGVAGVTQDAVLAGGSHTYRFVAQDTGTYWYHSHQVADPQVKGGLFGALVILPVGEAALSATTVVLDRTAVLHNYAGQLTINGAAGEQRIDATPGQRVRVRMINTDNAVRFIAVAGAPFKVLAIDGRDVVEPTAIEREVVAIPAGGRYDLLVVVPASGAVRVGPTAAKVSLVVGPPDQAAPTLGKGEPAFEPLEYGSASGLPFNVETPDRLFEYRIGWRVGFLDGRPGKWWSVNGGLWPRVPMFVVSEGDVVRMTVSNTSGEVHPMHLHGHHAVVLARNGVPASGSPWWVDSLDVKQGESYDLAFLADNPGVWMDHCHNLPHAAEGLVAHLAYTGVWTPFTVGGESHNDPE